MFSLSIIIKSLYSVKDLFSVLKARIYLDLFCFRKINNACMHVLTKFSSNRGMKAIGTKYILPLQRNKIFNLSESEQWLKQTQFVV